MTETDPTAERKAQLEYARQFLAINTELLVKASGWVTHYSREVERLSLGMGDAGVEDNRDQSECCTP